MYVWACTSQAKIRNQSLQINFKKLTYNVDYNYYIKSVLPYAKEPTMLRSKAVSYFNVTTSSFVVSSIFHVLNDHSYMQYHNKNGLLSPLLCSLENDLDIYKKSNIVYPNYALIITTHSQVCHKKVMCFTIPTRLPTQHFLCVPNLPTSPNHHTA